MNKHKAKQMRLARRHRAIRGSITGTPEKPRLCVKRTNANIYAMIIDDIKGHTLCSASTLDPAFKETGKVGSNKDAAAFVGELVGKRAIELGITTVAFDRGGHLYHGRVAALADAARGAGLVF
ncbi:MAG: 50S ribosomal protein L18 [Coriobacteriales bacterium]|nr:50S ribosomal protein L18 [Coriobacteriales bacterium]